MLFFVGAAAPVPPQDLVHIGLDRQQLPHLLAGFPVAGIGGLFLRQEGGILGLQVLYLGQLFDVQPVKSGLGRLVEQDVGLMLGPEF